MDQRTLDQLQADWANDPFDLTEPYRYEEVEEG